MRIIPVLINSEELVLQLRHIILLGLKNVILNAGHGQIYFRV